MSGTRLGWPIGCGGTICPRRGSRRRITDYRSAEGKLNLCASEDVFSNQIVGWPLDSRIRARLVVALSPQSGLPAQRVGVHQRHKLGLSLVAPMDVGR